MVVITLSMDMYRISVEGYRYSVGMSEFKMSTMPEAATYPSR